MRRSLAPLERRGVVRNDCRRMDGRDDTMQREASVPLKIESLMSEPYPCMQKPTKNHRVASLFFAARWVLVTIGFGALSGAMTGAQVSGQPSAQPGGAAGALAAVPPQAQPLVITLDEAIARARTSDPSYAASRAN